MYLEVILQYVFIFFLFLLFLITIEGGINNLIIYTSFILS